MRFIEIYEPILQFSNAISGKNEYLAKKSNTMARASQRRWAQCNCIGLWPALALQ